MTRPRSQQICIEATPYYHCVSRCVRRAFLCGHDRFTGKSFDHRKPWLVERMALLAEVFAIDIVAYAVMSNHYHLVLHVDSAKAEAWSDQEVLHRWTRIFKGPTLLQRHLAGVFLNETETLELGKLIVGIREKLSSISKFMSCMNYYIACKANKEDGCTGRFWEGRFKSQALLDEAALLSCMAYVDLNPVRAGIADSLETSDFTAIQNRIKQLSAVQSGKEILRENTTSAKEPRLMPFSESPVETEKAPAIPYKLKDYLELADWTGRLLRSDKKASISSSTPKILSTLGVSEEQWCMLALQIQKQSITMLHGLERLAKIEKESTINRAA